MWVFFVFSFFAATSLGVKDKMRHFTKWLPKPVPAEIKHDSLVNDRRILHWDKNQWIFQRLRVFRLFKIQYQNTGEFSRYQNSQDIRIWRLLIQFVTKYQRRYFSIKSDILAVSNVEYTLNLQMARPMLEMCTFKF